MKPFTKTLGITCKKDEASVLIVGIMLIMIVTIGISVAAKFSLSEMKMGEHSRAWIQALHTAEAGIEVAMHEFNRDLNSSPSVWTAWTDHGSDRRSLSSINIPILAASQKHTSSFSVYANEDTLTITSTGTVTAARFDDPVARVVEVVLQPANPPSWLDYGLLAKNQLKIQGNPYADAYDARIGPYDPTAPILAECDIGSMGIDADSFTGGGAAVVWGDASMTSFATTPDPPFWSGSTILDPDFPTLTYFDPPATNMTRGSISANTTLLVSGETYVGVPSVGLSGPKTLTIQGDGTLNLYVDGNFDIGTPSTLTISPTAGGEIIMKTFMNGNADIKGELNTGGDPINLQPYGTANCVTISCQANNDKALVIMAPNATVNLLGTAAIMGAVCGNNIHVGGTFDFHHDISLKDRIGGGADERYEIQSWMER